MIATHRKRNRLLAVVHIAKAELGLDDDVYRGIVSDVSANSKGSAANLSEEQLLKLIKQLELRGWVNKNLKKKAKPHGRRAASSSEQIALAKKIWKRLHASGVVHDVSDAAFRHFVQSHTRVFHPQHIGYSSLQFAPVWVTQRVIEQLKQWAHRCGVELQSRPH